MTSRFNSWTICTLLFGSLLIGCAGHTLVTARHPRQDRGIAGKGLTDPNDAQCLALLDRRDTASLLGKIVGGVGGLGALVAAPDDIPTAGRWGIAAGAAGLVAVGTAITWYADRKGDEFERYCEVRN